MHNIRYILLISGLIVLSACSIINNNPATNLESVEHLKMDHAKAANVNVELGLYYLQQKQMTRAKEKLLKAKKLAPKLPEVHCAYALYLEEVGENLLAEKTYQKAIHLNPKAGNPHHHYGVFLYRQHHYALAEKEFLQALNDPEYMNMAETLENMGLCALQIPDLNKAKTYFEKALRYDAHRSLALNALAALSSDNI